MCVIAVHNAASPEDKPAEKNESDEMRGTKKHGR